MWFVVGGTYFTAQREPPPRPLDWFAYALLVRAGASGFPVKDTEPMELLRAIRVVANGEALLSPSVTRRLIAEFVTRTAPRAETPDLDMLTDREREVMALVAAGMSKRGDRRAPGGQPGHRPDPREPGDGKAGCPRPRATGGLRLRIGAGPAGLWRQPPGLIARPSAGTTRKPRAPIRRAPFLPAGSRPLSCSALHGRAHD